MKKIILFSILILGFIVCNAQTSKTTIKSWFETGDVPTQSQFWTFIDNSYNEVTDDILDGQGYPTIKYAPYTAKIAGKFYVATANPSNNNPLKYDGYFYATKIYNGAGREITGETVINIGYGLLKGVGDTIYVDTTKLLTIYTFNNRIAKVGYGLYRSNDSTKIDTTKIATFYNASQKEPKITKSNGFLTYNGSNWVWKTLDTLKYLDATDTTDYKVASKTWTKSAIDYALTGSLQDMGYWDASSNTLPTTGSGSGGSVAVGDKWTISVKGKVTDSLYVGDVIIALYDYPEQDITKFNHIYANQPKSVNLVLAGSSQVGALMYNGRMAKEGAIHGGRAILYSDSTLSYSGSIRGYGKTKAGIAGYSLSGNGVEGYASIGFGVYGFNNSTGFGVYGLNNSTGYGVVGWNNSRGHGVYGYSLDGNGGLFQSNNNVSLVCSHPYNNPSNIANFENNGIVKASISSTGKITCVGLSSSVSNTSISIANAAVIGGEDNKGIGIYGMGLKGSFAGYFTNWSGTISEKDTTSTVYIESYRHQSKTNALTIRLMKTISDATHNNYILKAYKANVLLLSIDSSGYIFNYKPTFSSVFFDSTRVIELDVNTPKIISNAWGNLWPNSVLVGFTENKDTAIVGYTGNYNIDLDLNAYVEASVNFRYYVKKRPANTTSVTTIYRKEVSNSGTIVNRNIPLNTNLNVGDRIWFEIENITNGNDVTVYGGTIRIVANYLNP